MASPVDRAAGFRGPVGGRIVVPAPHCEPGDSGGGGYRAVGEVAFAGVAAAARVCPWGPGDNEGRGCRIQILEFLTAVGFYK